VRGYYVAIEATSTSVLNDLRGAHNENHLKSLMGKKHQLPFSIAKRDDDVTQLFTSPDESDEPRIRLVLLPVSPVQLIRETTPSLHAPYPGVDTPAASVRGADDDSTSIGRKSTASVDKRQHYMGMRYGKVFEKIAVDNLHLMLPKCLGLDFRLRNDESPGRILEDKEILAKVARSSKGDASGEIDVYGYADFYDPSRRATYAEEVVYSIGHENLEVKSSATSTDLRSAEDRFKNWRTEGEK